MYSAYLVALCSTHHPVQTQEEALLSSAPDYVILLSCDMSIHVCLVEIIWHHKVTSVYLQYFRSRQRSLTAQLDVRNTLKMLHSVVDLLKMLLWAPVAVVYFCDKQMGGKSQTTGSID